MNLILPINPATRLPAFEAGTVPRAVGVALQLYNGIRDDACRNIAADNQRYFLNVSSVSALEYKFRNFTGIGVPILEVGGGFSVSV